MNWTLLAAVATYCTTLTALTIAAWRLIDWLSRRRRVNQPPDDIPAIFTPGRATVPTTADVLAWDPPPVPTARLYEVGGWVEIGGRRVHRCCNEARRDGAHERVCAVCADRLGMAPAEGASS